ncbi:MULTISPECIES: molybdenum cofactor guanylyltransferase [unclassified Methanopyrus]|uniref:molybdenum cofactor guanylyltransferase n=1 Tax=unclassified Methanopyrus TaxID=2684913 RepID=UPI0012F87EF1|nr:MULTISPECIES: NTP transferase domain-containing protein [unclassified Methanopyrus]
MIGAVLMGGKGQRLGGDKPWLTVNGRPIVEWAAKMLRKIGCEEVYAVSPRRDGRWDGPWLRDSKGSGPMAGVRAVFREFPNEIVCVTSCDVVFDPRMFREVAEPPCHTRETLFPFLVHAEDAPEHRTVRGFLKNIGSKELEVPATDLDKLEDLPRYRALLSRITG